MNWLGWFLTGQPEQTLKRQTPTCSSGTELPLGKTRPMFFKALITRSLNHDQQIPVSYRHNSHVSVPPPGPSRHPHLPLPASPDPFLTQGSFTPSQLLLSEPGNLSVLQASNQHIWQLPAKFKSHRRKADLWSPCLHLLGNYNYNSAPHHCYNSSALPPPI